MAAPPLDRRRDLRRTVAALVQRRIHRVVYFGLRYDTDDPVDWDFDIWHHPEMAVELHLEDGARYSAVWGNAFGHFNVDLAPEPLSAWFPHIPDISEEFRSWDATENRRWAAVVSDPVMDARLIWAEGWGEQVPVAIHLSFPHGDVWIAAACPQDFPPTGDFYIASDELIVVFDESMAHSIGVADSDPRRARWLAYRTPCPRCGHRLEAVYAVNEGEAFLQCPDCGIGFSSPMAVEQPVGEVFHHRPLNGEKRAAMRDEIESTGWTMADFA